MTTLPVVWLSYKDGTPGRGYWDMGMLEAMFAHELWRPVGAHKFRHLLSTEGLDGAIIVFPARAQVEFVDRLNEDIAKLKWVVLILTGDEEATFPFEQLNHANAKLWVMSPRKGRDYPKGTRFIGTGYPPQAREWLPQFGAQANTRAIDVFFAGQITHERREQMSAQLDVMAEKMDVDFMGTTGFTEGYDPKNYYMRLANTIVAPAPSGPETPDSFRLFEALEAGCIPIADARVQSGKDNSAFGDDYWTWFFGEEPPFPVLTNYDQLPGYTMAALEDWKNLSNHVSAWWMKKKRQMAYWLEDDLYAVGAPENDTLDPADLITVLMPTSPILAHPSTDMIEQTITDVRTKLPESEIIIMVDGIRPEQEDRRASYEEYTHRLLWLAHHAWHNVLVIVNDTHKHQATMTREALEQVATPTILFVEHDAPITPDCDFDWLGLTDAIMQGDANMIRFHHEAQVLAEHEHLMLSPVINIQRQSWKGGEAATVPLRKTYQWSQRPHLASIAFYRQFLANYFNPESRTMIEDVMHGVVIEAVRKDGILGWNNFRLWIYTPEGNIKRSYHLDGRQSDPKYEMDIKPVERAE